MYVHKYRGRVSLLSSRARRVHARPEDFTLVRPKEQRGPELPPTRATLTWVEECIRYWLSDGDERFNVSDVAVDLDLSPGVVLAAMAVMASQGLVELRLEARCDEGHLLYDGAFSQGWPHYIDEDCKQCGPRPPMMPSSWGMYCVWTAPDKARPAPTPDCAAAPVLSRRVSRQVLVASPKNVKRSTTKT